ncbi:sortase [Candidatus Parcubacteria bacterium]|nr:sortase [Patescibacteria group bacterium]MBU4466682.1 sortase [Patescibacteria group bacterium]MCG2688416.1 sortase [Candidatus Parcubacteria bacterium]
MTEKFAKELKNTFLFFVFSFISIFFVLNVIQFFTFMGKQVAVLTEVPPQISSPSTPLALPSLLSEQKQFPSVSKENSLEIQKLGLEIPLVFAKSIEIKDMKQDLKSGAVVYPGSNLPGQEGKLIVLGHSSPPGWPKIRYDWVFSKLGELEIGDNVVINFAGLQYDFKVTKKIFLEKGQVIPESNSDGSKEFLYLVTCWPPGKDFKRLVVEAELTR